MQLHRALIGETIGTFLLVLFGTGSVAAAVLTDAQVGLWQVAVVWGFGVALAIYVTASISGAHLNPAVSLAFAIFRHREFPINRLFAYWAAQLAGAMLAGVAVLAIFGPFLRNFERENGIIRGEPGSERSAMVFGEYFPNPDIFGAGEAARALISPLGAAFIEGFGTAILVLVIFSLTDRRNAGITARHFNPFLIGFTVAVLISLFAPLTQAGWNPARDFGPRVIAFFAGWGSIAIPAPSNGFWVYIVGPLIGGPLGAAAHELLLAQRVRPGRIASVVTGSFRNGRAGNRSQADVLFVCVHNAGRSQMAKALFNRMVEERGIPLRAESAGTMPADRVHKNVVTAMRECGIDLSGAKPKLLTDELVRDSRRVITMGCEVDADACPALFIRDVEDWGLPDPAGKTLEEVRAIRDEIACRVERLIENL
ncbi:MAG: aquaporin [Chloroflexi bacterium]|nr:aquaporin [Chloroflexota bacterium]